MKQRIFLYWIVMVMAIASTVTAQVTPPPYDVCSSALVINLQRLDEPPAGTAGRTYYTLNGATHDTVPTCNGVASGFAGVWFTFVGTGQRYTITACEAQNNNNTRFLLFTGSCNSLVCAGADSGSCGTRARIDVTTQFGTTYYLLLSSAVGGPYLGSSSIKFYEHTVPGTASPSSQNVCYGGTPLPITTNTNHQIIGWQKRIVQYNLNGYVGYTNPWVFIDQPSQTVYPDNIYGGTQFRPVVQIGSVAYPLATPALGFMYQDGPNAYAGDADELCLIKNEQQASWLTWFREDEIQFFAGLQGTGPVNFGNTNAKSIVYQTIPEHNGFKFLPHSVSVIPTTTDPKIVEVRLLYHVDEFEQLQASDPAYDNKTIGDLRIVKFYGDVTSPNGFGEILPTTQYYHDVLDMPGVRISVTNTFLTGGATFFWTLDDYEVAPLPVTLTDFSAECTGRDVAISFSTASETNNDYFVIERSQDLVDWKTVTTVSGAGNSNQLLSYTATDAQVPPGTWYYRLTQYDFDGNYEVFDHMLATTTCGNAVDQNIIVYPNPTQGLVFAKGDAVQSITGFDAQGKQVFAVDADWYDCTHLASGVYTLQVHTTNGVHHKKVVRY